MNKRMNSALAAVQAGIHRESSGVDVVQFGPLTRYLQGSPTRLRVRAVSVGPRQMTVTSTAAAGRDAFRARGRARRFRTRANQTWVRVVCWLQHLFSH